MISNKTFGEVAYEKYSAVQHGRGHNGKKLVAWDKLDGEVQEQWERAALQFGQAATAINEARKERPSGGQRV